MDQISISPSLSLIHCPTLITHFIHSFRDIFPRNMQFAVLFSSLVAATIALPVPQTGVSYPSLDVHYEAWKLLMECSRRQVGSADALSGPTGGTESLFPGSANSVLSEGSKPVADLSNPSSGIVERSSGAGVSMFHPICQKIINDHCRLVLEMCYRVFLAAPTQ